MARRIHVPEAFDTNDGGEISFSEVDWRFGASHLGKYLSSQTRYSRYKPEGITNMQWESAPLGKDVNNMKHMKLTGALAKQFLLHQTPEEALNHTDSQLLMLTAYVHDWAEAVVGDITFDKKTETDQENEAQVMLFLLKKIFGKRLSQETLLRVYSTVKDDSTKLGEIFNAIERCGYLRTGLNAWKASKNPAGEVMRGVNGVQEVELRKKLQWLASNVAGNNTSKLLEYAGKHSPIGLYIGNVRENISDIFQNMPFSVFHNYPETEEQTAQMQKFLKASTQWQQSQFSHALDNNSIARFKQDELDSIGA